MWSFEDSKTRDDKHVHEGNVQVTHCKRRKEPRLVVKVRILISVKILLTAV